MIGFKYSKTDVDHSLLQICLNLFHKYHENEP